MFKRIEYGIIAIGLFVLGRVLLQGDYIAFLQWWVAILCLGMIFMPLTTLVFSSFHDKGYLFSKTIGIALTGYLLWLLSSLHILKFTELSCVIVVIISIILNAGLMLYQRSKMRQGDYNRKSLELFQNGTFDAYVKEELLFLALFLVFTYIRGFKPQAYGTEKFMDYGFMTTMMRSEYMPPKDLWFSGNTINYYYVGQYIATYLTKLSYVKVSSGYNLMLMMIAAFSVTLPYSLVYNVTKQYLVSTGKKSKVLPRISGMIAGVGVCFAGNMHFPIFRWIDPTIRKVFHLGKSTKYWFPDATRYIGYRPETSDKTIHEFPAYSFVLGDLHAHVINILFVLTVLGILFAWQISREKAKEKAPSTLSEIFHPAILLIGFFIGLYHTTNYWDYPIYFVVAGAVILFSNLVVYKFKGKALWLTALQGITIVIVAEIICLPFTLSFDQISTRICFAVAHTPLHQLMILWGLPMFMVIAFLCFLISNFRRLNKAKTNKNKKKFKSVYLKEKSGHLKEKSEILQFIESLHPSDLFIILIGLCAIGLILIPEIVYVQDIYSGDYKRANTMFKLTYQAFIMFGICFGYLFLRLLRFGETKWQKIVAFIGLFLFTLTLGYPVNAVNAWYGNVFHTEGYLGIDAAAFMETEMPDDYLATNWLNENVTGTPVVLEANGDSYTDYQRVSVITGLPTVLGWRTHEWLWRSDTILLDERATDIQTIYTSVIEEEVLTMIEKYNISYLYVGDLEQEKYETINHDLLKKLGTVVFSSPVTTEKQYETYIVQIKK